MRSTGSIIMSIFGAIWWIVGGASSDWSIVPAYVLPVLVTFALVILSLRMRVAPESITEDQRKRRGRIVGIASGVEGLVIFVVVNILSNTGAQAWTAPAIAIVVGLHFLPLARWLPARLYYATSGALVIIGLVGICVSDPLLRIQLVCPSAACVLWLTSVLVLRTQPKTEVSIGHGA